MKLVLSTIFTLSFLVILQAQDPHLSRYNGAPTLLNPALTGIIPVNAQRLGFSHRSQWGSFLKNDVYNTDAAAFDMRICIPGSDDFFGIGANILYDGMGFPTANPPLSRLNLMASASFVKHLSGTMGKGNHLRLAIGAETGFIQHSLDAGDLDFLIQFKDGAFDHNIPGETFSNPSFMVWDAGIGLLLYSVSYKETQYNKENPTATGGSFGFSVKHLNKPDYKFFSDSDAQLNRRWAIHCMGSLELAPDQLSLRVIPVFLWQKPFYNASLVGEVLLHLNNSRLYTHLGAGFRRSGHIEKNGHTDALLITSRFDVRNMAFAFSYDANVSSLSKVTHYKGAWELSLLYHFGESNCNCHCDCPN